MCVCVLNIFLFALNEMQKSVAQLETALKKSKREQEEAAKANATDTAQRAKVFPCVMMCVCVYVCVCLGAYFQIPIFFKTL